MAASLATGILFGLSAGFAPGPLLALVVSQTLRHNAREGVKVALAPLVTDLPIILVSLFLSARLSELRTVLGVVSVCGGLYVSYLAYESFRTHRSNAILQEASPRSLRKGILTNALSPHPYLFWLAVGAPVMAEAWEENGLVAAAFVGSFYLFLVGSKVALALTIGKSRDLLRGRAYAYVMRILGTLLLLFAFLLLKDGAQMLGLFP